MRQSENSNNIFADGIIRCGICDILFFKRKISVREY